MIKLKKDQRKAPEEKPLEERSPEEIREFTGMEPAGSPTPSPESELAANTNVETEALNEARRESGGGVTGPAADPVGPPTSTESLKVDVVPRTQPRRS